MSEHQNTEYKTSWRDEYLKWICGFANAQGGSIFIGINDHGEITNKDYQELNGVSDRTALRDLNSLLALQVIHRKGRTGKYTSYYLNEN